MRFGSLFAGIGGFDLGLERAGMECAWQVEIDPLCRAVLAKHWPNVKRYEDIRECGENLERVDLVCGGFPCQDISVAGGKRGLAGARSGLWREMARVVRVVRPRFVLVENVAALLERGMGEVLGDLAALGYDAEWTRVSARDFGAPHLRERIFIVADSERPRREGSLQDDGVFGRAQAALAITLHGTPGPRLDVDADRAGIRVRDGLSVGMERRRLHAIGNAIVPQIPEWIGRQIMNQVTR